MFSANPICLTKFAMEPKEEETVMNCKNENIEELKQKNKINGKRFESRSVQFCLLKYKCILMLTFAFLSFFMFIFTLIKEVSLSGGLEKIINVINSYNNHNKTLN